MISLRNTARRGWLAALLAWALVGCAPEDFTRPGPLPALLPATLQGYYAEFCAVSQILKRPGFGANIRGEAGGHAIFYLHGACRARDRGPTTLALCDTAEAEPGEGAGLSMNSHFRTAKWVATPGREFFLHGDMPPGAPLTFAGYEAVQARAKALGIYAGVEFHDEVFDDMPRGWQREDWKYEVSVATDYGLALGRGRFCARVPVTRAQLMAMVEFLNAENAPYRDGSEDFHWSLFQDNCIHLAHNALSQAGFWPIWPTNRPWLVAMFDFPTPRNEVVNLLHRGTDAGLLDPARLHADPAARHGLLQYGQLPLRPGVLLESRPPQQPNAVYETDLRLIFFDDPTFGSYQGWFDALQANPANSQPAANLEWVRREYARALAARRPLAWWLAQADTPADFPATWHALYAALEAGLARLEAGR